MIVEVFLGERTIDSISRLSNFKFEAHVLECCVGVEDGFACIRGSSRDQAEIPSLEGMQAHSANRSTTHHPHLSQYQ